MGWPFSAWASGSVRKAYQYETRKATYLPTNDLMVGEVVHFASAAKPYDSQAKLFAGAKSFLHKYLELPADFEEITALYVLLTWVFEFAPSIPYLRVIGDWGTGKTRFLQVAGAVCFRAIFASGATTPAPIFTILERFRGTLALDEAAFKDSAAWSEMVKLLNNGYRPGMPVLRAEKDNGQWYPKSYQVFGPKLISTRFNFKDEALESRCLTSEMLSLTRDDIPRVLPPAFELEVADLRSKLLTFRLANLNRLKGKTFGNELLEPNLQPRLQEILIPLKAMLNGDGAMVEALAGFVHRLQDSLYYRRKESLNGKVLMALIELHDEDRELSSQSIAGRIEQWDEDSEINSRKVGWIIKRLGFVKERTGKNRQRIIRWDEERVRRLSLAYGLPVPPEKTSETSAMSAPALETADVVDPVAEECPPERPPDAEADPHVTADEADGADVLCEDTGTVADAAGLAAEREPDPLEASLHMTREQAVAIWEDAGRPAIPLGQGTRCVDLSKLFDHQRVDEYSLFFIKAWLEERQQ